jgi:hypothetical protein
MVVMARIEKQASGELAKLFERACRQRVLYNAGAEKIKETEAEGGSTFRYLAFRFSRGGRHSSSTIRATADRASKSTRPCEHPNRTGRE